MIAVFQGRDHSGQDYCGIHGNRFMWPWLIAIEEIKPSGLYPIEFGGLRERRTQERHPSSHLNNEVQVLPLLIQETLKEQSLVSSFRPGKRTASFFGFWFSFTMKKCWCSAVIWFNQNKQKVVAGSRQDPRLLTPNTLFPLCMDLPSLLLTKSTLFCVFVLSFKDFSKYLKQCLFCM